MFPNPGIAEGVFKVLGGGTFADRAGLDQTRDLLRAARNAEWNVPEGRIGGVIRQLRARGDRARRSALWNFRWLVVVIFAGLIFYLGLPFYQSYVDGRRLTLTETLASIEATEARLALEIATARADLVDALTGVTWRVPVPSGRGIETYYTTLTLPDGTVLIGGSPEHPAPLHPRQRRPAAAHPRPLRSRG